MAAITSTSSRCSFGGAKRATITNAGGPLRSRCRSSGRHVGESVGDHPETTTAGDAGTPCPVGLGVGEADHAGPDPAGDELTDERQRTLAQRGTALERPAVCRVHAHVAVAAAATRARKPAFDECACTISGCRAAERGAEVDERRRAARAAARLSPIDGHDHHLDRRPSRQRSIAGPSVPAMTTTSSPAAACAVASSTTCVCAPPTSPLVIVCTMRTVTTPPRRATSAPTCRTQWATATAKPAGRPLARRRLAGSASSDCSAAAHSSMPRRGQPVHVAEQPRVHADRRRDRGHARRGVLQELVAALRSLVHAVAEGHDADVPRRDRRRRPR